MLKVKKTYRLSKPGRTELEKSLNTYETNYPISLKEGRVKQGNLEKKYAEAIRKDLA